MPQFFRKRKLNIGVLATKNAQTSADRAEDESTQLEQTESTSTASKDVNELKKWVSRLTKKLGATQNENKSLLTKNIEIEAKNAELTTQLNHWKAPPIHQNYIPPNLFNFPPPPINMGAVQNSTHQAQSHPSKK
ncbi:hypothetical protein M3Y97_00198800 [Aphelenchoides bicaudatus]|nr:hypothetical protein M3Y97_00198800 [Aphelenchoides bicaudatus]